MLIDGRLVPATATLHADVAVVGAGPAGISASEELARAGLHVMLVDAAGRTHDRSDDDALRGEGSHDPFPLVRSRHRGFGGTSTHWTPGTGLRVRPLDDVDFAARPGRPDAAWPFGPEELEPWYERAAESIGLRHGYAPERWYGETSPTALTWPGGPQLAMFQFADHDCFTRRYQDVADHPRIDLVLHSTVREIEVGSEAPSVRRLAVVCPGGNQYFVEAATYVLACGAIDNARLLLASPGRAGRGVGNEHDNVGRYFMDHLSVDTGIIVPAPNQAVAPELFREARQAGDRYQPMLWLGEDEIIRRGIPNAAFWVEEIDPTYLSPGVSAARKLRGALHMVPRRHVGRHVAGVVRGGPQIARYALGRLVPATATRRVIAMRILTEQLPDRESRIRLSDACDRLGMPRAEVHWRIGRTDLDVIVEHQTALGAMLEERGVAELTARFDPAENDAPVMSNFHHLGSTRMHVDPRKGVVDADCRVHSEPNLFVLGGSVFPTGGYLNPTLTIIALALRSARRIIADHESRPRVTGTAALRSPVHDNSAPPAPNGQ